MHTIEFYSDIKKKKSWNLAIFDNTDGPRRYWVKWISQTKINIAWFHLHVDYTEQSKWTNTIKQEQSHRDREHTGSCQRGGSGGAEKEKGKQS